MRAARQYRTSSLDGWMVRYYKGITSSTLSVYALLCHCQLVLRRSAFQGRIQGGGPFGGPPKFIQREKTLHPHVQIRRVLVLNSYLDTPHFQNPVSAPPFCRSYFKMGSRGKAVPLRFSVSFNTNFLLHITGTVPL